MGKSKTTDDVYWSMHPIVGEVTDESIVMIFRLNNTNSIRLKIYNSDPYNPGVLICKDYDIDDNVSRIVIPNPHRESHSKYLTFSWLLVEKVGGDTYRENCIYTHYAPCCPDPDKIYLVSCDLPEADLTSSHWDTLYQDVNVGFSNILLHIGDQAYCDREFHRGYKRIQQDKYPIEVISENIKEEYRKRYERTYLRHHNLLSCVSNLCILDDHEIVNDSWNLDYTSHEAKHVAEAALQVYHEYQLNLLEDIPHGYSTYKVCNGTLIMMIERTTSDVVIADVLQQINHLCSTREELFLEAKLILCFTSAPIPKPGGFTGRVHRRLFGSGKFWSTDDLEQLYSGLFQWLDMERNRAVYLCGGDIHFGVKGVIRHKKTGKEINTVVTSGITNYQTIDRKLAARAFRKCGSVGISEDIVFHITEAKAKRNFATINLMLGIVTLTWSNDTKPKSVFKYRKQLIQMGGFGCGMTSMKAHINKNDKDDSDITEDEYGDKQDITTDVNRSIPNLQLPEFIENQYTDNSTCYTVDNRICVLEN